MRSRLLEMNIGIFCLSLPAFSKMLRHHLPPLDILRSRLHSQFIKLQSRGPNETTSRSRTTRLDGRALGTQPAYELGDSKRVQTFIRRGADSEAPDDKIHLTCSIEQEQARLDKTDIGR